MRVSGEGSSEPTIISASWRAVVVFGSASPTVVPRRMTVIESATLRTSSSLCEMKMTVRPSRLSSAQVAEQLVDLLRHEHGGRLVEDQDAGAAVEHLGDLDPLPVADAEVLDQLVGIEVEGVAVGDLADPARGASARSSRPPRVGSLPRTMFSRTVKLSASMKCWWTMPMPAAMASAGLRKCTSRPSSEDRALVGAVHAVEGLHQRRLAGAVLTDDRVHLAAGDPQLDVAVGDDAREALGDAAQLHRVRRSARCSHRGPLLGRGCAALLSGRCARGRPLTGRSAPARRRSVA